MSRAVWGIERHLLEQRPLHLQQPSFGRRGRGQREPHPHRPGSIPLGQHRRDGLERKLGAAGGDVVDAQCARWIVQHFEVPGERHGRAEAVARLQRKCERCLGC